MKWFCPAYGNRLLLINIAFLTWGFQHAFLILFIFIQQMVQAFCLLHADPLPPQLSDLHRTLSLACYEESPWLPVLPPHTCTVVCLLLLFRSVSIEDVSACAFDLILSHIPWEFFSGKLSSWFQSPLDEESQTVKTFRFCGRDYYYLPIVDPGFSSSPSSNGIS